MEKQAAPVIKRLSHTEALNIMLGLNRYLEANGILPEMEGSSAWKIAERLNFLLSIAGTNRKVVFDNSTIPASLKFGFAPSTRTTKKK